MLKPIVWFAAIALVTYGALLSALWFKQEALLFRPQSLAAEHRFQHPSDVHEVWLDAPGARLNALHLRLPQPRGVVFFLHGNGGNLQSWFVNLDFYRQHNLDLFMLDYRGYGKSTGRIGSEAQLHADVRAAWQSVAPRYTGLQRVFFGPSLGTGLAAALAVQDAPDLTVLVSPYLSMQALAQQLYPWVPSALLRYPLRTDLIVGKLPGTVLLVHGDQDNLIRPAHSQSLQNLRPGTQRVLVQGAGHNDLQDFPAYAQALAKALMALPAIAPTEHQKPSPVGGG